MANTFTTFSGLDVQVLLNNVAYAPAQLVSYGCDEFGTVKGQLVVTLFDSNTPLDIVRDTCGKNICMQAVLENGTKLCLLNATETHVTSFKYAISVDDLVSQVQIFFTGHQDIS